MKNINTRSIVVVLFVIGFFVLAIIDENFRAAFVSLANVGVGGYLGQLVPKQAKPTN